MIEYDTYLLNKLKKIEFKPQGVVGDIPFKWAKDMEIAHDYELPNSVLSREEVKGICQDLNVPVLKSYLVVMAWGAQGRGPGGKKSVQNAWRNRDEIEKKISLLREKPISRKEAYDLFCKPNSIPGLGPAYFTKLLYFFGRERDMYIMDQWTTKPILLLTKQNLIKHTDQGPSNSNSGKNYEVFCKIIDDLKEHLGAKSGDEVEQKLFSVGSIKRQARGEFRQLVHDLWKQREPFPRYNARLIDQLLSSS